MKKSPLVLVSLVIAIALASTTLFQCTRSNGQSDQKTTAPKVDDPISENANKMLEEGRQTFRFETFGDEAFWTDALQLHKSIAGDKHGGVGAGLSPKAALATGLK